MKHPLLLLSVLVALFTTIQTKAAPHKQEKDGIFIHITHGADDPHRVLMGLQMANIMKDNYDTLVYFDIDAITVVLAGSKDLTFPNFQSSQTLLKALREKNVFLVACPGCLASSGKTEKDLAPGIKLADKDQFFSFTKGRILTLDY